MHAGFFLPYRKRKPLDPETQHKLVWGWFRLVVGLMQMTAAAAAILSHFDHGLDWRTSTLLGIGLGAAIFSRWLYRGR